MYSERWTNSYYDFKLCSGHIHIHIRLFPVLCIFRSTSDKKESSDSYAIYSCFFLHYGNFTYNAQYNPWLENYASAWASAESAVFAVLL